LLVVHQKEFTMCRLALILSSVAALAQLASAAVTIDADNALIQYTGRCDFSNPKAVRFEWTGVYIKASFEATSVGVRLDDGANSFSVYIDGQLRTVLVTTGGSQTYTVATGLAAGTHTLLLAKRTESYGNIVTFRGLELSDGGQLVASAPRSGRRIQFIGDSFTSGAYDESDGVTCDDRQYTNSYLAFAAYAACSLQADYHLLSRGGIGLVRNYGSPNTTDPNAYPSLYGRLFPSQSQAFDSASWVPQLVVICLGLNDFTSQPNPSATEWKGGLLTLINRVRVAAPGAGIMCVGERFDPQITYTREVVLAERTAGRTDVYYCNFTNTGTYVCDHPHVSEQHRIAGVLVRAVTQFLGWTATTGIAPPPASRAQSGAASLSPVRLLVQQGGIRLLDGGASMSLSGRVVGVRQGGTDPQTAPHVLVR